MTGSESFGWLRKASDGYPVGRLNSAYRRGEAVSPNAKPGVEDLGVDVAAQIWQRSSDGDGAIEIAFVEALGQRWVLMRIGGDPTGLVLVYDRHEWECFVDGAKRGEFDDADS